jgi:hypothetical protein
MKQYGSVVISRFLTKSSLGYFAPNSGIANDRSRGCRNRCAIHPRTLDPQSAYYGTVLDEMGRYMQFPSAYIERFLFVVEKIGNALETLPLSCFGYNFLFFRWEFFEGWDGGKRVERINFVRQFGLRSENRFVLGFHACTSFTKCDVYNGEWRLVLHPVIQD